MWDIPSTAGLIIQHNAPGSTSQHIIQSEPLPPLKEELQVPATPIRYTHHQDISHSNIISSPSSATKRWLHREVEAFQHPHWQQNGHSKVNRAQARPEFNTHSRRSNIRIAVATASIRPTVPGLKGRQSQL
ncbi:hypothetical protein Nepgr_033867 [Nepenthes gracilis]|uniref:Uncharacterized protein n=1 Tax=Nepenthes gracilis TaxID=150966 RepID=A0AAD3Y794_NEPGR|nr:hypothetical protein Nepgr_033867 [Nepenthes gracilis]